jgi:hypothetical protein
LTSSLRDQTAIHKSPLNHSDIPEANMGGGVDGYRSVAYFVNVSGHLGKPKQLPNNLYSGQSLKNYSSAISEGN